MNLIKCLWGLNLNKSSQNNIIINEKVLWYAVCGKEVLPAPMIVLLLYFSFTVFCLPEVYELVLSILTSQWLPNQRANKIKTILCCQLAYNGRTWLVLRSTQETHSVEFIFCGIDNHTG